MFGLAFQIDDHFHHVPVTFVGGVGCQYLSPAHHRGNARNVSPKAIPVRRIYDNFSILASLDAWDIMLIHLGPNAVLAYLRDRNEGPGIEQTYEFTLGHVLAQDDSRYRTPDFTL
jgi:hypothetical protein